MPSAYKLWGVKTLVGGAAPIPTTAGRVASDSAGADRRYDDLAEADDRIGCRYGGQRTRLFNQITDPDLKKAASQVYQQMMSDLGEQAATRQVLRDLYSPTQLRGTHDLVLVQSFQRSSRQG